MIEMLTEPETIALLGRERFERLRAGGWISPCLSVEGYQGSPVYVKNYTMFRLEEDRRLRGGVVTKSLHGSPANDGDRDEVLDRYDEPPTGYDDADEECQCDCARCCENDKGMDTDGAGAADMGGTGEAGMVDRGEIPPARDLSPRVIGAANRLAAKLDAAIRDGRIGARKLSPAVERAAGRIERLAAKLFRRRV